MIEALIAGETDPAKLASLADRRVRASQEELREALRGRVTKNHRFLLCLHLNQIDALDASVATVDAQVERILGPFRTAVELVAEQAAGVGAGQRMRRERSIDRTVCPPCASTITRFYASQEADGHPEAKRRTTLRLGWVARTNWKPEWKRLGASTRRRENTAISTSLGSLPARVVH
jgi:transposase